MRHFSRPVAGSWYQLTVWACIEDSWPSMQGFQFAPKGSRNGCFNLINEIFLSSPFMSSPCLFFSHSRVRAQIWEKWMVFTLIFDSTLRRTCLICLLQCNVGPRDGKIFSDAPWALRDMQFLSHSWGFNIWKLLRQVGLPFAHLVLHGIRYRIKGP